MESLAQSVLGVSRALLPSLRVRHPVGVVGDVGPGANEVHAHHEVVDVAAHVLEPCDALFDEVGIDALPIAELDEDVGEEHGVVLGEQLAEVGDATHVPEQGDALGGARSALDVFARGEDTEHGLVGRAVHQVQPLAAWARGERGEERRH